MKPLCLTVALLVSAATAHAAPFDGSTAMKCTIKTVMMCSEGSSCVRGTAASALLPAVMNVDVPGRRISGDAAGRVVKIVSVGHGPSRLVLHGEEVEMSGTAWNAVIDQKSGDLSAAVLSYVGGYLMFGSCTE
jgi:hypothetical protein